MAFQRRNLSSEDIAALEALAQQAEEARAITDAVHAHAAQLHFKRPHIAKAAIAEYAAVSRPTVYSWIDKHRPDWRPFVMVTSFNSPDAVTGRPFGFRLPASWPEARGTSTEFESSGNDVLLGLSNQQANTLVSEMSTAIERVASGISLRAIEVHYGNGCFDRLVIAWLRLDGIDDDTLRDILAWNPDD